MVYKVFSIRDQKGEIFNTPFFQKTHGEAERSFMTLVNDDKTSINKYPEDYDLYYLGEYNDSTGQLESEETPKHVQKAISVLKTQPSE